MSGQQPGAPAVQRPPNSGRPFRALVRHGTGIAIEIAAAADPAASGRDSNSRCRALLHSRVGRSARDHTGPAHMYVPNHCGFGVVEEVGPDVKRVQVGDRVVVAGTSQCGVCYQCLHGRPDYCQFTFGGDDFPAVRRNAGQAPVLTEAGIGGLSELMAVYEEYCVPVFTDLPAAELCLLGDQLVSGFSAGHSLVRFEAGSDVVVFGAGPVGVGAIQAGRVAAAAQVIAVEPIKYRREFALKMGATTVLDPMAEGDGLVERIRELCKGPDRPQFRRRKQLREDSRLGNVPRRGFRRRSRRRAGCAAQGGARPPDPTNVKTVCRPGTALAWAAT